MKPAPLFDLGNVLVRVDFRPFFQWLKSKAKSFDPELGPNFLKSSIYSEFEKGALTRKQFTDAVAGFIGQPLAENELTQAYCQIFPDLVPGMAKLIGEFRAAGPVYGLSNTNEMHLEYLRLRWPKEMGLFSKLFVSHEMGLRKPDPEIYRRVAREIGRSLDSLVFFDDLATNIEGAKEIGLEAYLFVGPQTVRAALK